MRKKPAGYIVMEQCDNFEQALGLRHNKTTPPGGVLEWTPGPKALFRTRSLARAAIIRTEHYRLAWGFGHLLPSRAQCTVVPVVEA